ncbi:MAG: hypothetical protein K6G61_05780 [Solobacterium sp.]|nr:hypothetical protein [Solobacterium sp.]
MEQEKLRNYAVTIDTILKIFRGFMLAAVILCTIFIPLILIFGEKMIASANSLAIGHLTIRFSGDMSGYLDVSKLRISLIVMLASGIVTGGAGWYCLNRLREIIAPMKEGRPFEAGIADKIRDLGWTVLIAGGTVEAARLVGSIFELNAYDLSFLLKQGNISGFTFNYTIDLWFAAAALILFFMSYIFRCGEVLQKESDETL